MAMDGYTVIFEQGHEETFESNTEQAAEKQFWSYEDTILLIAAVESHYEELHHPTKRKHAWENISNDLLSNNLAVTHMACYKKWKNLVRSYKTCKDNMKKSGRGPIRFNFFTKMDEILGEKPNFSSPHSVDIQAIRQASCSTESHSQTESHSPTESQSQTESHSQSPDDDASENETILEDSEVEEVQTKKKKSNIKKHSLKKILELKEAGKEKRRLQKQKIAEEKIKLMEKKLELEERKVKALEELVALRNDSKNNS